MKFSIKNKVVLGFAVAALMLGGISWLSYHTVTKLVGTLDWVAHTREVIGDLRSTLAALRQAETTQRGFLLTGDPASLADYHRSALDLRLHIEQLRKLTADNPTQQQNLDRLTPLVEKRLAILDQHAVVRQQRGLESVANAETLQNGKDIMSQCSDLIAQMSAEEESLLTQREQAVHAGTHLATAIIVISGTAACALGLLATVVIRRDFQLREHVEEELEESRALLESILDNTPALVFLKDTEGHYLFVNRRFQELAGSSREEMIGKTVFDIFPKEIAEMAHANDLAALKARTPMQFEETVLYPDGPHIHWMVKFPLWNASGQIYATGAVSTDITERKHAEEERDRFFNLSRDLLCIADFSGYFKALNPAWEHALGFSREELMARPFVELVHPDDRAATRRESEKLAGGDDVVHFENRYACKDGSYRWLAWSSRADVKRQLIYATARDVTEQKQTAETMRALNEELAQKAAALEAVNEELEAFSYSVSHDLRAPLRHIDGFVGLLNKQTDEKLDERSRRHLKIIADSARQMGNLIDDLLVFSRMGRTELRRHNVDLGTLVHEAIAGLEHELAGRNVKWKIESLPQVQADPTMLRQVLVNLIGNAIKYTRPRDPAEIEIGCEAETPEEFVFFVRDNGVGFDMQYVDKLFGVFQRLHRSEEFEGTGIGLANVRRIIHRHGGRTWAEGKIDNGATVYFTIPKALKGNYVST